MTWSTRATTLTDLARSWAPHLQVVSVSQPEPHLERHNVIATTGDAEAARRAVLELEAEEMDTARIGLVALGPPTDEGSTVGVDPEGVGRSLAPRILVGGALGAVIGAALGALIAIIAGLDAAYIATAAIAGAALLAVPGAIWATFPRMGGSDAYRQTFVDEAVREINIVSLHTPDREEAERALARLRSHSDLQVRVLDARGAPAGGTGER